MRRHRSSLQFSGLLDTANDLMFFFSFFAGLTVR
jgi:hypothetical protein